MFQYAKLDLGKLDGNHLHHLTALKEESWQGTHRTTIINSHDQKHWFEGLDRHPHSPRDLYLIAKKVIGASSVPVGVFKINSVDYINRTAEVGWDIFKDHRGKGYGKRLVAAGSRFCFDILNLNRLTAEILPSNIASQRCAQASGFRNEGQKRQAILRGGKYEDSCIFGLLAMDFVHFQEPTPRPENH